jgi:hypothetical protein
MTASEAIAFSSLLIGLISGVHPIEVQVLPGAGISSVVFRLDGSEVARVEQPPWRASIDFGSGLLPHELVATARDGSGREVGRTRRSLNTPQSPAKIEILMERDHDGRPIAARVLATSVRRDHPVRVSLKLDGSLLVLDSKLRAGIPTRLDLSRTHVLSATADFSGDAIARTDVAFGGDLGDAAISGLTAVPLRLTTSTALDSLGKAFQSPRGRIRPVALDRDDATILVVRHPLNIEAARRLGRPSRDYPLTFDDDERVGIIWPIPVAPEGSSQSELFESAGPFGRRDLGYHWLLASGARVGKPSPPPYRFADAVAVAGLQASGSGTRRAVVLVEGEERRDASRYSPAEVELYLSALGVPLRIWSMTGVSSSRWHGRETEDISSFFKLTLAVKRLKEDLNSQRIAWFVGDWLPGEISVSDDASGISLLH